jgi:hypothetical protein
VVLPISAAEMSPIASNIRRSGEEGFDFDAPTMTGPTNKGGPPVAGDLSARAWKIRHLRQIREEMPEHRAAPERLTGNATDNE